MKEHLIDLLTRFNEHSMDFFEFRSRLNAMLREGVKKSLSPEESEVFKDFVAWHLDIYDPQRPPRPGLAGKLRDMIGQLRGDYRVSETALRTKAEELRQVLSRHKHA